MADDQAAKWFLPVPLSWPLGACALTNPLMQANEPMRSPRLGSSPNAVSIAFFFARFFNQLRMAGELQLFSHHARKSGCVGMVTEEWDRDGSLQRLGLVPLKAVFSLRARTAHKSTFTERLCRTGFN
jgi:hypothetical protein